MKYVFNKVHIIVIIILLILWVAIFKLGLADIVYNLFSNIKSSKEHAKLFEQTALFLNLALMTVFSVLGFNLSGNKNRNKTFWTILCLLFNVWAFLILWFLPKLDNYVDKKSGQQ